MIGFVVVSHSRALAEEAIRLTSMFGSADFAICNGGGLVDSDEFGTDVAHIMASIESANQGDGVIVFCELGSSILSAQMAVEMLADPKIRLADAPLVEGLIVGVASNDPQISYDQLLSDIEEVRSIHKN